jgi:hypothetical protein
MLFSGTDGALVRTLQAPNPQTFANFGQALAALGDINGDGVPDLAVGIPAYDRVDLFDQGQVVLFSGTTGSLLRTLQDRSLQAGGQFGRTLAALGDINGDGVSDLAVGAPFRDVRDLEDPGQVVLFSGVTGARLHTLRTLQPQGGAQFGSALAAVGDVNGDGVSDLAVGAPFQDVRGLGDLGQVFVFSVSINP